MVEAETFKTELEQASLKRPVSLETQVCWSRAYDVLVKAPSLVFKRCEDHLHVMPRGSCFISNYFCFQCFCLRYFRKCERCNHVYHWNRLDTWLEERILCCSLCIIDLERAGNSDPVPMARLLSARQRHSLVARLNMFPIPLSPIGSLWDTDSEGEEEEEVILEGTVGTVGTIVDWDPNEQIPSPRSPLISTQQ